MKNATCGNEDYQEAVLAGLETICGLLCVLIHRTEQNAEPTDKDIDVAMLRGPDMMWTRFAEKTGRDSEGNPYDI